MARKKNRRKKKSNAGFWLLEGIVVLGFAALFFNAQAIRQAAMETDETCQQSNAAADCPSGLSQYDQGDGWETHRPRFSTVVGELWKSGF